MFFFFCLDTKEKEPKRTRLEEPCKDRLFVASYLFSSIFFVFL